MIRIGQIKIAIDEQNIEKALNREVKRLLKIDSLISIKIVKRSIDARKKPVLFWVYTVDVDVKNENKVLSKSRCKQAMLAKDTPYIWPEGKPGSYRPIIIGMGPAGLFCGYMLAKAGAKPILFERGKDAEQRTADVESFWNTGVLNTESNVQFGEGGAGTFSDGKLNTLVNDKFGRNKEVLSIFVKHGAPECILYDSKPHIGTDILKKVVINMRKEIIDMGGEVYFESKLTSIEDNHDGTVTAYIGDNKYVTDALVLAIGHSARDTFAMLKECNVPMEAKAFALGLRVMHPQRLIDERQYGKDNLDKGLPASPYKLTYQSKSGRGVYSFCMCPGGYVVNASSEENRCVVNGMSYSGRDSGVANSAIIVSVTPEDFGSSDVLAGVEYQRRLEERAYKLADGAIPYEKLGDFKKGIGYIDEQETLKVSLDFEPAFKGLSKKAKVHEILDKEIAVSFAEGMNSFDRVIPGFASDDAYIAGIESRTSSPVRINRDETHMSKVRGIYPCGEGAGYAGGIMSAAMDGMLIAEEIWKNGRNC